MSTTIETRSPVQVTLELPDETAKIYHSFPRGKQKKITQRFTQWIQEERSEANTTVSQSVKTNEKDPFLELIENIDEYAIDGEPDASINHDHYLYGTPKRI